MTGLVILISGGMFYYYDLQADVETLERKHQIAMQSMRLKTNGQKVPDKSAIIQNLVSDGSSLNEKVVYAKNKIASERKVTDARRNAGVGKPLVNNKSSAVISIKKVNKNDPVGEKLEAAWVSYESAQYSKAKELYIDILSLEANNRDALLGLAAIAVIEKENAKAKTYYFSLLELDPRDPIATAALSNLRSDQSSLASDEIYLQAMLEKNADSHQLNFQLGNIYAQQNKWQLAQKYYFEAWKRNNDNADYLFNLAVSMDHLGKKKQALTFYKDSLIKSDNKNAGFSRDAVKKRINKLSQL
ncbi:MAG: tetratricopeptide repeat protein [Gammaproteobacteria bacterium]|nr:tetratricopeptide repeat protein [Gammaproteobacteria bacterium]